MTSDQSSGPASQRYNLLAGDRDVYLQKAREAAKYTLPSLIPEATQSTYNTFYQPWQSLGSRGVNNLASKLLLALFPSTQAFFRLSPSQKLLSQIEEKDREAYDQALAKIERVVRQQFDSKALRAPLHEGLKHLLVSGNATLHIPPSGAMRVFGLSQFVTRRDPEGTMMELIVKESVDVEALPPETRSAVIGKIKQSQPTPDQPRNVDVFTWVRRSAEKYEVSQEAAGIALPGSGFYPLDRCPWIVLRWTRIDGEHYGRGMVEDYLGDLRSYENLSKSSVEAGAISARTLFGVRPGAIVNIKDLTEAKNGEFVLMNPDDVKTIQAERFADMQVVNKEKGDLRQALSYAFMLNSSVQRDAERVTAEEIRYMAQELESALGGVYSVLASDFQLPLVRVLLVNLQKSGDLPKLPEKGVDLTIVTGFDALGRTSDIMRLNELLGTAAQLFGPQVVQYVSVEAYMKKALASYGLDGDGLIRTEQDVAEMNKVQMTQALAEKAAPNAVKAMSDQALAQQQQPQQETTNG